MLWCTIPGHKGYLSARDDSLCVGVYVCVHTPVPTQPFGGKKKKSNSHCKIAETLAAHCSGCNGVAVKHVSYKKRLTLRDAAVSDLHVDRTVMVASFTSEDVW